MADWQTQQCLNFRDLGESLDSLSQATRSPYIFPKGLIFRGGEIDYCAPDVLRNPKTVINLRMGSDNLDVPLFKNQGAKYVQLALPNSIEKYDTSQRDVKDWLQDILLTLQNMPAAEFPVMIHCRAGRDRTGIVIATILTALGFPRDLIIEEFLLSSDTTQANIDLTLDNLIKAGLSKVLRKVNFEKLRTKLGVLPNTALQTAKD